MEIIKNRRKNEYIKYSKAELERYVCNKESCVKKIQTEIHLGLAPWMLKDLQSSISKLLSHRIGKFDVKLQGIVLDFRNTRILSNESIVRHDSPVIHINVQTNFYVFIPERGAELAAMIKHITITKIESNILTVVYRVFNVKIVLKNRVPQDLQINKEIKIRIVDFHYSNEIPYILAELVTNDIDSGFSGAEESIAIEQLIPLNDASRKQKKVKPGKYPPNDTSSRCQTLFKAEPDSSSDVECLPNGLTKKKPGRDDVSHEKPEKLRKKAKSQLNQDILSIFEEHKQESSSNKNAFSESMLDDINSKKNKKSKNTSKSEIASLNFEFSSRSQTTIKSEPESSSDVDSNDLIKKKRGIREVSQGKPEKIRKKAKSQINPDILSIFEEHKQFKESSSNNDSISARTESSKKKSIVAPQRVDDDILKKDSIELRTLQNSHKKKKRKTTSEMDPALLDIFKIFKKEIE